MTDPAVSADLHETLDVQGYFSSEITFYDIFGIDDLSDRTDFFLGKILDSGIQEFNSCTTGMALRSGESLYRRCR